MKDFILSIANTLDSRSPKSGLETTFVCWNCRKLGNCTDRWIITENKKQPAPRCPERRIFWWFIVANHTIVDTSHRLELFPYQLKGNLGSNIHLPVAPRVWFYRMKWMMNFLFIWKKKTPHEHRNTQINGWIWRRCGKNVSFGSGGCKRDRNSYRSNSSFFLIA